MSGVLEELQVLLHGLRTAAWGNVQAVKALPAAPPKLERDVGVFFVMVAVLFIFNWGTRYLVIEPLLARRQFKEKVKEKFAQSFMEMIFYGAFSVIGLLIVIRQDWIWPSSQWWIGWRDGAHEAMRSDLRCYYLAYAARYFQGGVSGFLEHKRKDFLEMQIHHWTTVSVIYISYMYGWNRIGCIVMLILDPADTCLHIAKMFKYTSDSMRQGDKRKVLWQQCADGWFVMFALVWFATRLVMYPYACWSAHIEATRHFEKGIPEWACVALLEILLVLQCYWSYLLIKGIVKMVTKGGVEDVRSDSDVSDVGEQEDKKKTK